MNELQAKGIDLSGFSYPCLPFFLNVLWVQSKLSALGKHLGFLHRKHFLTSLMSIRFTVHRQNNYVK